MIDANAIKAGMSFPQGFGLGYKDKFYLVNIDGKVKVGKIPAIGKVWDIFYIRGIALIFFAIGNAIKMMPVLGISAVFILLLPLLILGFNAVMPSQGLTLAPYLMKAGGFVMLLALLLEIVLKFPVTKSVIRTFRWHSVEHKTFSALMRGKKATIANLAMQKKEQPECGSTLVFWIFAGAITFRAIIGNALGMFDGYFTLFVIVPVVYEIHRLNRRKGWNLYSAPGWLVQQIVTIEPVDKRMYVAGTRLMQKMEEENEVENKSRC